MEMAQWTCSIPPSGIDTFLATDYYGLALWRLDASGVLARHSLLDWKVFPSVATASDLNGDGLLDVALVARNLTVGSALVVLFGQRNGAPVFEGYYPLLGKGNQVLRQRCQRRWRHRSDRTGNESGQRPRRRLRLYQSRHPGHQP